MSITLSRSNSVLNVGVLPPGIEDDIVFGIMWIRVGALKISKPSPTQTNKVRIQFWGESSPAILCPSSSQPQTQEYDVFVVQFRSNVLLHFLTNILRI